MIVAKKTAFIAAVFLLTLAISGRAHSQESSPSAIGSKEANCQEIIDRMKAEGDPRPLLLNPVLSSKEEVRDRVALYRGVLDCMDEIAASDYPYGALEPDVKRFLSLVDDSNHKVDLVNLETSSDKAVKKLRDKVGLPAPKGFVYVNYFQTRDELPDTLSGSLLGILAEGVTVPCRFVVVLKEQGWTQGQEIMHKATLSDTVSHELVHAYFLAILGPGDPLPEWFHEGAAVYFGGSGSNILFTSTEVVSSVMPEDYEEYGRVFRYLRSQLGEQGFNDIIRWTIGTKSVEGIFAQTGSRNYRDLASKANDWEAAEKEKRKTENPVLGILLVGVVSTAVGLILLVIVGGLIQSKSNP